MSVKRTTTYTCDSCGCSVSFDASASAPVGWSCLAINSHAADPAWDADGWRRYLICIECRNALQNVASGLIRDLTALGPESAGSVS